MQKEYAEKVVKSFICIGLASLFLLLLYRDASWRAFSGLKILGVREFRRGLIATPYVDRVRVEEEVALEIPGWINRDFFGWNGFPYEKIRIPFT